jgi:NADPH2:quinone reductase
MKRRVGGIDGQGRGICRELDVPELKSGQVKVAVQASLISPGTELGRVGLLRKNPESGNEPRNFGYTNAGVVEELGAGVQQFEVGQRVACMGGGYALHTDLAIVPQNLCVALPDEVSFEEGSFVHLAATALHAIRRVEPLFGENGMVMGLGLVGQMSAQFGQLSGCHMMGVDRFSLRLEKAQGVGIETIVAAEGDGVAARTAEFTQGYGMDFGVIAFGGEATAAFEQIYASLKMTPDKHKMGRIVIVGGAHISHGFASGLGNVDVRSSARTGPGYHDDDYEHGRAYPQVFVEWPTQRNMAECMRLVAEGKLAVRPLITHEIELSNIADAVDLLVEQPQEALGVVLKPGVN